MTIGQLPYQLPTNSGFTFVQTTRDNLTTSPADGTASCQASVAQVPSGERWEVTRISIQCVRPINPNLSPVPVAVPAPSLFTAYYNRIDPDQVADASTAGALDIAEESPPIVLNEGDVLLLVWTNCPLGAVGYANVTRNVFRRVNPS